MNPILPPLIVCLVAAFFVPHVVVPADPPGFLYDAHDGCHCSEWDKHVGAPDAHEAGVSRQQHDQRISARSRS